jgi:6-phosphofructokinase 1
MAGKTDVVISFRNQRFIHVPIALTVSSKKRVDPEGELWSSVLSATGQPARFA